MALSYSTIGIEIVLSVVVGFMAGRWLDGKLGTAPWLSVVGFFFGVAAAARSLWRTARRMKRETERDGFRESDTDRAAHFRMNEEGRAPRPPRDDDEEPSA